MHVMLVLLFLFFSVNSNDIKKSKTKVSFIDLICIGSMYSLQLDN